MGRAPMVGLIPEMRRRTGFPGSVRRAARAAPGLLLVALLAGCASAPPPHVDAVLVGGSAVQDAGGEVEVVRAGSSVPARSDLELQPGDEVHTGPGGRAVLLLEGGRVQVIVFEGTQVVLGSVFVKVGKVVVRVLKKLQDTFEVESDYAVAGAEGTEFLVAVGPDQAYRCAVLEGLVQLRSPTGQWTAVALAGGEVAVGRPGDPISTRDLDPAELNDLVREVNEVVRAYDDRAQLLAPDVLGLPVAEARRTVEAYGFTAGEAEPRITGREPVGTVIEQRPPPGGRLPARGRIGLVVEAEPSTVPDLSGLPLAEAERRLAAARLKPDVARAEITGARRPGEVLRQQPAPGTEAPVGSLVLLWVEAQSVEVPALVRGDLRRAEELLRRAGLQGRTETRLVEGAADGLVLEQRPAPGTPVPPGTVVELLVAERAVRVPDLVGSSQRVLSRALGSVDLAIGQVSSRPERSPPGTILEQNPRPGTLVRPGTPVHVTVAAPCTVPDVRRMTQKAAVEALSRANLGARVVQAQSDGYFRQSQPQQVRVVAQDPPPGARVQCGSAVLVTVAPQG